ncbi:MAG TPA: hypothetical protein VHZ50_12655 [Puia sp.]|nr:hypothetical protein [Puia sp.]
MKTFNGATLASQRLNTEGKSWHAAEIELSDKQKDNFVTVFGKHCRTKTINALRSAINDKLRKLSCDSILRIIVFEGDMVSCCPGQDYNVDVAYLRSLARKHY